jgi:hypothetical protein
MDAGWSPETFKVCRAERSKRGEEGYGGRLKPKDAKKDFQRPLNRGGSRISSVCKTISLDKFCLSGYCI